MTEDEAKTKWCPFARVLSSLQHGIGNRDVRGGSYSPGALCIASACMAWRWDVEGATANETHYSSTHGYCGLAGID